jgi:hypothetical protein
LIKIIFIVLCDSEKIRQLNITLEVLFILRPLVAHLSACEVTEPIAENDQQESDPIAFLTNQKVLPVLENHVQVFQGQSHRVRSYEIWPLVTRLRKQVLDIAKFSFDEFYTLQ